MPTRDELIESVPIVDVYADGVSHLENLGGVNFRAVYYVWSACGGGIFRPTVVARIVRPQSSITSNTGLFAALLKQEPVVGDQGGQMLMTH